MLNETFSKAQKYVHTLHIQTSKHIKERKKNRIRGLYLVNFLYFYTVAMQFSPISIMKL